MGLQRVTTLITPAATYALVALEDVKIELGIPDTDTSKDALLTRYINEVSGAISRYCNRSPLDFNEASFPVELVQDLFYPDRDAYPYQVPGGTSALQLARWPLVPTVTLMTSADAPSGNVLPFASTSGIAQGQPVNGLNLPPSATVAEVSATSVTLNAPVALDLPAGTKINFGISIVIVDPPGTSTALVQNTDFVVNPAFGQLIRLDQFQAYPTLWTPVATTVVYSGGYSSIPDDVQGAAMRWITQRFSDRGRNPNLRAKEEPGVGREEYWVGGPPMSGGVPAEIAEPLDSYRTPVTA